MNATPRLSLVIAVLVSAVARAAEPAPGPDASFPRAQAATRFFNFGRPLQPTVTADGKSVLFLRARAAREPVNALYELDIASGQTRELLTPAALLKGAEEKLSPEERARRERQRQVARGFTSFELSHDGRLLLVGLSGRLYTVARPSGAVTELPIAGATIDAHFSPDAKHVAYVKERDLYVLDLASLASGRERRLTRSADPAVTNGLPEFIAQEEIYRFSGYWWSPDSRTIAYEEADSRGIERRYLADPRHPESAPEMVRYPAPGKPNAKVRVALVPIAGGQPTWVRWDTTRRPYLATVRWQEQAPLTLVVQSRDQKLVQVLAADRAGGTRVLAEERDARWVDLDQSVPAWLPDGSGFLWSSEGSGIRRLELHDATGKLVRPLSSAADV